MNRSELSNRIKNTIKQKLNKKPTIALNANKPDEMAILSANILKFPIVARFPEVNKVLLQLMTDQYGVFIKDIEWVAPRPTTFRVKLENNQYFYLTYGEKSWEAQVEGKKYWLNNIQEEERAAESLSRILRYGGEKTENDQVVAKEPSTSPGPTPTPGGISPEPPREPEGFEVNPEEFTETPPEEEAPEEEVIPGAEA